MGDNENPGSRQRDGAMVYVALIAVPGGQRIFPGSLDEVSDLLGAAVRMHGQVAARVEEHASYS